MSNCSSMSTCKKFIIEVYYAFNKHFTKIYLDKL